MEALKLLVAMPAAGAGIGGLIGAARAEKGKRLRTALGDAGVGGMAGLGFALGGTAGGAAGMALGGKDPAANQHTSASMGGMGAGLGAVGAGMLGQKLRKEMEEEYDIGNNPLSVMAKVGSREDNVNPYHTAGIGAGAGALIGALKAPKGKMLKYTLGGAGIGGLTGGAGGIGWNFGNTALGGHMSPLRLPAAIGGSALGAHLGNKLYDEVEEHIPEKKDKKKDTKPMKKMAKPLSGGPHGPVTGEVLKNTFKSVVPWMAPRAAAIGAAGGGVLGGLTGKGVLRGALRGGLIGTGVGVGAPLGAGAAMGVSEDTGLYDTFTPKSDGSFKGDLDYMFNHMFTTLPVGGVAGGVGGGMAGNALYNLLEKTYDNERNNKDTKPMKKTEKQSVARSFGEKLAAGFDMKSIMNTGLGGAALGAGLGGLAGLIAPGEDGTGKRRGRLSGALRGALGGGALGGAAGAIGEAASPGFGQSAYNYANDLYRQLYGQKKKPVLEPLVNNEGGVQSPDEYRRMLDNNLFYGQTGRMNMPNELSGNYLPDYGVPGGRVGPSMQ